MGMEAAAAAAAEGSPPSTLSDQEAQCYLNRYADLRGAFGATNIAAAKTHWVQYGKNEKRIWSCSLAYEYSCMDAVDGNQLICRDARTKPENEAGGGRAIEYLDRHDIACEKDEVRTFNCFCVIC